MCHVPHTVHMVDVCVRAMCKPMVNTSSRCGSFAATFTMFMPHLAFANATVGVAQLQPLGISAAATR